MDELRDRLRAAAPTPEGELEVDAIRRRAARRRRRRVASVVTTVVVVAATVATLAVTRDHGGNAVRTVERPDTTTVPPVTSIDVPGARGVAAGGGALWVAREKDDLDQNGAATKVSWALERRDLDTGALVATIDMPGVVHGVAVNGDLVAAFGGGDGGYPDGGVAIVDATTNRIVATYGWDSGPARVSPVRAAATAGAIWITDAGGHLLEFSQNDRGSAVEQTWNLDGQPTDVVATADGALWVWRSQKQLLSRFDPEKGEVTASYQWCCGLFAADGTDVWVSDLDRLIELRPDLLAQGLSVAEGDRLPVRAAVVVPDRDGLWVAVRDGGLQRWSRRSFTSAQPAPDAAIDTDMDLGPWGLAAHGDTAWFVTQRGLGRWQLAASGSNAHGTSTSTTAQGGVPLRDVDWANVQYPLDCGGPPAGQNAWRVWDVAYAEPANGVKTALVLVTCNAGAGSPPANLFVYDRAASASSVHLSQTLVQSEDNWLADHVVAEGVEVSLPVQGYSSDARPRCCPDVTATLTWQWQGDSYRATSSQPAHQSFR